MTDHTIKSTVLHSAGNAYLFTLKPIHVQYICYCNGCISTLWCHILHNIFDLMFLNKLHNTKE